MRKSLDNPDSEDESDGERALRNRASFDYPVIFGTFSNWKAYQMMRAHQFSSVLVATTNEDRRYLVEHVFDAKSYAFKSDFKSVYQQVYPVLAAAAAVQGAQLVGTLPTDPV